MTTSSNILVHDYRPAVPGPSWTCAARASNLELSWSRDRFASSRLRLKRILPLSTKMCAMPQPREVVRVADRQDRHAAHGGGNRRNLHGADARDIQQVACPQRAVDLNALHADDVTRQQAALDAPLERVADRRVAEDTRVERGGPRQPIGGPFGELRKVVDERRFERRLRDVLRMGGQHAQQGRGKNRGAASPPAHRCEPEHRRGRHHGVHASSSGADAAAFSRPSPDT